MSQISYSKTMSINTAKQNLEIKFSLDTKFKVKQNIWNILLFALRKILFEYLK